MDRIQDFVAKHGADNLIITIPMRKPRSLAGFGLPFAITSSDDPEHLVDCVIDESRYKIEENYKIGLKAIDSAFGSDSFYITDLNSLLRSHPDRYSVRTSSVLSPDPDYHKAH